MEMKSLKDTKVLPLPTNEEEGNSGSVKDLFHRINIDYLERAITNYTSSNEQRYEFGNAQVKAGLNKSTACGCRRSSV